MGLLSLLDEESNFPKATDLTLLTKFHQSHEEHPSYVKPKTQIPVFGVAHYAGDVVYQVEGFLDKNRDTVRQDLIDLLASSGNPLVAAWFLPSAEGDQSTSGSNMNLSGLSMGSLNDLAGSSATLNKNSTLRPRSSKAITIGYQFNVLTFGRKYLMTV